MRESSHTHLERVHQCQCGSQDACQHGARDEGRHAEPVKEHDNYYVLLYTSNKAVPKQVKKSRTSRGPKFWVFFIILYGCGFWLGALNKKKCAVRALNTRPN